jgi:hypothetical protein
VIRHHAIGSEKIWSGLPAAAVEQIRTFHASFLGAGGKPEATPLIDRFDRSGLPWRSRRRRASSSSGSLALTLRDSAVVRVSRRRAAEVKGRIG